MNNINNAPNFNTLDAELKEIIFNFNRPDPVRLRLRQWYHMKYYFCRWRAFEVGNNPWDGFTHDQLTMKSVRDLKVKKFVEWCRNGRPAAEPTGERWWDNRRDR